MHTRSTLPDFYRNRDDDEQHQRHKDPHQVRLSL